MDRPDVELAAAIVVHQGQILIVRRSDNEGYKPGVWGVPCGKINAGEHPDKAVLRELREETGLLGEVIGRVGESEFSSPWGKNRQINYLVRPLRSKYGDGEPPAVDPPEEDQEWEWVPTSKIEKADLDDHNLQTIRQGLARLGALPELQHSMRASSRRL